MESTMVIKVKFGDTLRRFNARVNENETLDLDIDGLRAKVQSLFNFPEDADLTLTYIDEDGDVVTLVDDDDLCDVMRQRLKFLRINVRLNSEKFGKAYARSSGSSTPLRCPRVQHPLPDLNKKVSEILKFMPEPLQETLLKLSQDFTSKAVSSTPMFAELVECFSKMGLSHLYLVSQSQSGAESSAQGEASESPKAVSVPKDASASKDGGLKQVLPNPPATGHNF
ncbi:protein NBR1-like [Melia azedarach]|uniref:Protein NBR1-like n=1 Tax=Melia azedarach TaxID=155640 RepID=A0ACC1XNB1_MELAZ|nr:protein NBR1-like [Melia azedarach]